MWRALVACVVLSAAGAAGMGLERVASNAELASALQRRVPHIIITEHLDLTLWEPDETAADKQLFQTHDELQSITGACTQAPSPAVAAAAGTLEPLKPNQCVLAVSQPLFVLSSAAEQSVALERLYIKAQPSISFEVDTPLLTLAGPGMRVYLRDVTFHRQTGPAKVSGLSVGDGSALYCTGCAFHDLQPDRLGMAVTLSDFRSPSVDPQRVTAAFEATLFERNTVPEVPTSENNAGTIFMFAHAALRLKDVDFQTTNLPPVTVYEKPVDVLVFANGEHTVYWTHMNSANQTRALDAAPGLGVQFLTSQDPWLLETHRFLESGGEGVDEAAAAAAGGGGGGLSTGAVAGIVVGLAVALVLAAAVAALALRHRRKMRDYGEVRTSEGASGATTASDLGKQLHTVDEYATRASYVPHVPSGRGSSQHTGAVQSTGNLQMYTLSGAHSTAQTEQSLFSTLGGMPTGTATAETHGPLDALERVLDEMHEAGELFFGRFAVLNFLSRRAGGQGCVQFVRRVPDQVQFAVKFFLHNDSAFKRELELYETPALRSILPEALHIRTNEDSAVRAASGYVFPPFIIVEKGESLNEWASRKSPDFATTLFVLLHIAERLQRLHAAGLCHRDVKPANILWRPLSNSWTLIDYGCAAKTGDEAELLFSLPYAPPEVAAAAEQQVKSVTADAAVDVWALGIISFELLTRSRVFVPFETPAEEIMDQLQGRGKLPWEGPQRTTLLPKLRALKRSVLSCLARDPAQRPTSAALLGKWNSLLEAETGGTRAEFAAAKGGEVGDVTA